MTSWLLAFIIMETVITFDPDNPRCMIWEQTRGEAVELMAEGCRLLLVDEEYKAVCPTRTTKTRICGRMFEDEEFPLP